MTAGIAVSAIYLRLNGDLLSYVEPGHLVSQLHDLAGYLMSLGYGVFGKRMFAVIYMDI